MKKNIFILLIFYLSLTITVIAKNPVVDIIGYSVKEKAIEIYKFGNGKDLIIIFAGIHGNERNTSKTSKLLIEEIRENKIKIPSNKSVWIIPELNPDGLEIGRRLNTNDVDLNRNFKTKYWKSQFYFYNVLLSAGKKPFSEPETKAVKSLFENINPKYKVVALSLHSRGSIVIPGNKSIGNLKLSSIIESNTKYQHDDIGYNTFGDLTSWLSNTRGLISATIEFHTKTMTDITELRNIFSVLLKLNFNNEFYKDDQNIKIDNSLKKEDIKSALNNLPETIINKITSSKESIENFLKLYNELQKNEELLLLVNKENRISKSYVPEDLVKLDKDIPKNKNSLILRKIIIKDLKQMINDAKSENINLRIISAYRSFESQEVIYQYWVRKMGVEEASRVSAIPGASQHQLGTTVDINELNQDFGESKEGLWLLNNAYKYGFIMSYPEGKEELTGYRYEPWHYRYVGKEAAYIVYNYFDNLLELFLRWYWARQIINL